MPNFTDDPTVIDSDVFSSSITPGFSPGTRAVTRDGRVFRYAQAGAVTLVVGNVIQASAQIANHQQLTPIAVTAGATSLTVTLGATAVTAGQYSNGWAIIDTAPGLGYLYLISGHPAALASGTLTLTLASDSPIQVDLTASSRVSLQANAYTGVIQSPVILTGAVVGVAVYPVIATQYGWLQTHGPGGTLIDGTPGVGAAVVVPASVPGAVAVDGAALPTKVIGTMMVTGVTGKVQAVLLDID